MIEGHYVYDGSVLDNFGNILESKWHGETIAPSKKKAISNLKYRFRKEYDMQDFSKIYLDYKYLTKFTYVYDEVKDFVKKTEVKVSCQCSTQLTLF